MLVEQEFDTPGDALAHYGKKGMRWGHRNTVKSASTAVSNKAQSAKQGVQGAASKTAGGISSSAKGAKQGAKQSIQDAKAKTTGAVNNKVQGVKANAQARADAKAAKATAKAHEVADNKTVKAVGTQVKGTAWGVRQAYIEKTLKAAERAGNIDKGTAGLDTRVIAVADGVVSKRQAKYAEKAYANHAQRVKEGKLKTRDLLLIGARIRRSDLTIGMNLATKKGDRARKRGREVNYHTYDMPKLRKG